MYLAFEELPQEARVWVYTAERILSEQELNHVSDKLKAFAETWQSHQKDMKASFQIVEKRFIIIAADESFNDISGCGIDKSTHAIQELESELKLSLTDKSLVVFERGDKQFEIAFNKIRTAVGAGMLDADMYFYNTLVSNVFELKNKFRIKSGEGWVKKYFNLVVS